VIASDLVRTLSLILAGVLSAPPQPGPAGGAEPQAASSAEALYEAGEQAFGLGDFDLAIQKFEAAYAASKLVVILYNVGLSHMRRFELSGDRKDLLRARAVLRNYVLALEADPSLGQPDDAKSLLAEIDGLLDPSPSSPKGQDAAGTGDGLKIGLGVAGGLAGVSLVIAFATGATIVRQPFQGSRYQAIYDAAAKNGVSHGPNDDMCALGADVQAVADACGRRDTMRNASIAMFAVGGILVATAVTLGILHARRARTPRVSLVVDPQGVLLGARGRF
jgi:tetratricopeptide (TPR) repeat protein